MELSRDILLRGDTWANVIDKIGFFFKPRVNYNIFKICLSIGILYDSRIQKPESSNNEEPRNVPRNVLQRYDLGLLESIFQASILTTKTVSFSDDERLYIAFDENSDFNKLDYLVEFANFGATKLEELIGDTPAETMEKILGFVETSMNGTNLDLNSLPDDILISDY